MNINEKELLIKLKNNLIHAPEGELEQFYNTEIKYRFFIRVVYQLIEEDSIFLAYFTPAIDTILNLINHKRFEFHTKEEVREVENYIICGLNQIRTATNDKVKKKYKAFQEKSRTYRFENAQELLRSIAYDACAIELLKTNQLELADKDMFIASVFSLMDEYPELWINHKEYIPMTKKCLEEIKNKENEKDKLLNKRVKVITKELKRYQRKSNT